MAAPQPIFPSAPAGQAASLQLQPEGAASLQLDVCGGNHAARPVFAWATGQGAGRGKESVGRKRKTEKDHLSPVKTEKREASEAKVSFGSEQW